METPSFLNALRGLGPAMPRTDLRVALRGAAGAAAGIVLAVLLGRATGLGPEMITTIGSTSVLVFVTPNSPLAQPWSVFVGALIGIIVGNLVSLVLPLPWAGPAAVGLAIVGMTMARALHPPGASVALFSAIDGAQGAPLHLLHTLPFLLVILVGAGMVWARLTGRVYPLRTESDVTAVRRTGLSDDALRDLLVQFRQGANIGTADLARLVAAATDEAARQRFHAVTCGDIMSSPPIVARPGDRLPQVMTHFRGNAIASLPVVDAQDRPLGLIQAGEIITALTTTDPAARNATAADLMRRDLAKVPADLPVGALLHALASEGPQIIGVMDGPRLVGIITRTNVVSLLLHDEGWNVDDDDAPAPPAERAPARLHSVPDTQDDARAVVIPVSLWRGPPATAASGRPFRGRAPARSAPCAAA